MFASRGVLPLSVGTAQKLLLSENLLSSAKLLSRSILFRRRQKRGEPADGLSSRGGGGEEGGEEKALAKTSSFRIGRDTVFRSCLFAGGLPPGRMLYASQIGAERNAYDRQIDALFVRATPKNARCTSQFVAARARARSYKTDDSWERLNEKEIALSLVT